MSKSPCEFDGKPIGAAMDAKSPFHAGVTMGKDQVERMEETRKARNRILKAERKRERQERIAATPQAERDQYWRDLKFRRNRALNMLKALRNGTAVQNVANYWRISPDVVLADVKWYTERRHRHKARHSKQRLPPEPAGQLPQRRDVDGGKAE